MLKIRYSSAFKKDLKPFQHDKSALSVINTVLKLLVTGKPLPREYKDHSLKGDYIGYLECHGKPDFLLIYKRTEQEVFLYRVESHAKLFKL
ncbi:MULTISPECIES: type II toxin-antitoxin system YafQ family toxin [Photorhabdus]|uniref:RelE/StbE family addiction module toxin n=1 Tax=Photorhabdus thracensis TaxID=230089 RepID=A0A0F7LNS2_9GAMM|nr:type II toxin-antitoxin system YafQ family toxin [Photorhabdus thracensis]AKH63486.1 RelE/StbE family addiction module toxin [Photorhabdus thracensis]MCC8421197.1 type II toxin-antitoxin system YafQ family toxin [Photorhabdus thracensis]